jgi:hypothetical protein
MEPDWGWLLVDWVVVSILLGPVIGKFIHAGSGVNN